MKKISRLLICFGFLVNGFWVHGQSYELGKLWIVTSNPTKFSGTDGYLVNKVFQNGEVSSQMLNKLYELDCAGCNELQLKGILEQDPDIEIVEQIAIAQVLGTEPIDFRDGFLEQWYFNADHLNVVGAWKHLLPSDPKIPVAVIDVQLDFDNTDLCPNVAVLPSGEKAVLNFSGNDYVVNYAGIHPNEYDLNPDCGINPPWATNATTAVPGSHGLAVSWLIAGVADNDLTTSGSSGYNGIGAALNKAELYFYNNISYRAMVDAANKGVRIINCSWASRWSSNFSKIEQEIINEVYNRGVLVVAAAGNQGGSNCLGTPSNLSGLEMVFPASYNHVLSVTKLASEAGFSTHDYFGEGAYNQTVDLGAPGRVITLNNGEYLLNGVPTIGKNQSGDGSSASSPMVAGIAAMCFSVNPSLNNKQVEYILKRTATDFYNDFSASENFYNKWFEDGQLLGVGIPEAEKAVLMARSFDPNTVVPYADIPCQGNYCYNLHPTLVASDPNLNQTPIIEGFAEGGTITWTHDGKGFITYPEGPNGTKAIYHAAPNDIEFVIMTMNVTDNFGISSEAYVYIKVNNTSHCSAATTDLYVRPMTLPAYKEYNYLWSVSPVGAAVITVGDDGHALVTPTALNSSFTVSCSVEPTNPGTRYCPRLIRDFQFFPSYSADAGADVCSGLIGPDQIAPGVTYEWSPAEGLSNIHAPNPEANPCEPTTYVLTTTDICGNVTSDEVIVDLSCALTAGEDRSCPGKIGPELLLPGTTYSWSPVDGLDYPNSPNPFANPLTPTTYILTINTPCGETKHTVEVNIPYDADNIEISGNVVWDGNNYNPNPNSPNYFPKNIRGRVLVKKGATLTIRNTEVRFGPYKIDGPEETKYGILVAEGGRLNVQNATLADLGCSDDLMWKGIEVWSTKRLIPINGSGGVGGVKNGNGPLQPYAVTTRGTVQISNSVVENAHWGIYAGRSILPAVANNKLTYLGSAVIDADQSQFINNHIGIKIEPGTEVSKAILVRNQFICNDLMSDQEYYPNQGTQYFVEINDIDGVSILGNRFENTTTNLVFNDRGTGVKSFNSSVNVSAYEDGNIFPPTVYPNQFSNITHGINAYGSGALDNITVKRNEFDRVYFGVTLQGTAYDLVSNNYFLIRESLNDGGVEELSSVLYYDDWGYLPYAIYAGGCTDTEISNNEIQATDVAGCDRSCACGNSCRVNNVHGVVISNSNDVVGSVVRGNKIEQVTQAITTFYDNKKLRIHCNEMIDNEFFLMFNYIDKYAGELMDQSSACNDPEPFYPDNLFIEHYTNTSFGAEVYPNTIGEYGSHIWVYNSLTNVPKYYENSGNLNSPYYLVSDPLKDAVMDRDPDNTSTIWLDYGICPPPAVRPELTCPYGFGIQPISIDPGNSIKQGKAVKWQEDLDQQRTQIRDMINSGDKQTAFDLLAVSGSEKAKSLVIADQILEAINSDDIGMDIQQKSQTMSAEILEIYQAKASQDFSTLKRIAGNKTLESDKNPMAYIAQGILDQQFGEQFPRLLPKKERNFGGKTTVPTVAEKMPELEDQLNLYPNPGTTGVYFLKFDTNQLHEDAEMLVMDLFGRVILEQGELSQQSLIDISTQPKGVYCVKIVNGSKTTIKRIIYQ